MLLAALACALQVAAASTPPLPVLFGDRRRQVPTVAHPEGGLAMRADLLSEALGATFVADGADKYHLQVGDDRLDVEIGRAGVRVGDDVWTIGTGVYRQNGRVFLPFALVRDVLPRAVSGVIFDADQRELRRFGAVSSRSPTASSSALKSSPSSSPPRASDRPSERAAARQRVVIVDAGHGGVDKGMSGPIGATNKVYEKDITLAVARQLKAALEQRGITVIMTRTSDTLIALGDRGKIANQAKGDAFVSIHVNAANPRWTQPGGARGYETYFLAEAKTEDERRVEAMENEVVKFETSADVSASDPLGFIMRDMAQNEHLRESSRLADFMQSGMARVHPGPSRGVKQAGFMVLVKAFMPAVLVEIGFGSNRAESQYMSDPANQRTLAESLAAATEQFLAQYERKVGTSP